MKVNPLLHIFFAAVVLFCSSHPLYGQNTERNISKGESQGPKLRVRFSDQDIFLPVSSLEWGIPERWSFTSRFIHMFKKDKDTYKRWLSSLTVILSPGTTGGRVGIGYQGILSPKSMSDFAMITEARIVLLRTWGNPLATNNDTFIGPELRMSLSGMFNIGFGYYSQISRSNDGREKFYGVHIGIGI